MVDSRRSDAILAAFGADMSRKFGAILEEWDGHSYQHTNCSDFKFVVIKSGPKNTQEAKKRFASDDDYVVFIPRWGTILLKSGKKTIVETTQSTSDYARIMGVVSGSNIKLARNEITISTCLEEIIDKLPKASSGFVNPGMFSPHYLKTRMENDMWNDVDNVVLKIIEKKPQLKELFPILGWGNVVQFGTQKINSNVTLIVTCQDDLSLKIGNSPAPSSMVIDAVKQTPWVILTNGVNWRLYTSKIAAVTTDYFQVNYDPDRVDSIKYLVAVFSAKSYYGSCPVAEKYFHGSMTYTKKLEKNLQRIITDNDGPFFNLVMAVLNHDSNNVYSREELDEAKDAALRALYRIWFVLYAESRDLLPVKNARYYPLSFQAIHTKLDSYETNFESTTCWDDMVKLFAGMRHGDPKHNLPPYDGEIFAENELLDTNTLQNKFIAKAFRALVEDNGDTVDYASLDVRNIGSIYETLMDITVRQADKDIMVYEEDGTSRVVSTKEDSNYTYKKGDLYLVKKGGLFSRKNTGSYYTPEKFVEFLVKRGLEPLLLEREAAMGRAIKVYNVENTQENRDRCIDLLFSLRIIDPAMGSGHFLVESLNKITAWATALLSKYPDHPAWDDLRADRDAALTLQQQNNIDIDENLLKHETLLKRRIMKQCIFGVDLNPLAVELAKFSLWLDSFAIGVPLTYMDHHLKVGDSTMGLWLSDIGERKNQYLDGWQNRVEKTSKMMFQISRNSDITVDQVHQSAKIHEKCESNMLPHKIVLDILTADRMDRAVMPSNVTDKRSYAERFSVDTNTLDKDMLKVRTTVQKLSNTYHFFHWELEFMDVFNTNNAGGGGGSRCWF